MKKTTLLLIAFTCISVKSIAANNENRDSLECIQYFDQIKNDKDLLSPLKLSDKVFKVNSSLEIDVQFDYDAVKMEKESQAELDAIQQFLIKNPNLSIQIEVHSDMRGSEKYNLKLSETRAKSIQLYLTSNKLISPERVKAIGMGETSPIISLEEINKCNAAKEYGYNLNRRTILRITAIE